MKFSMCTPTRALPGRHVHWLQSMTGIPFTNISRAEVEQYFHAVCISTITREVGKESVYILFCSLQNYRAGFTQSFTHTELKLQHKLPVRRVYSLYPKAGDYAVLNACKLLSRTGVWPPPLRRDHLKQVILFPWTAKWPIRFALLFRLSTIWPMPCENTISMKEIGEAFRLCYITRLGFGSFLQFIFLNET